MAAQILLIEDNAANLELMLYLLQAFGYHPHAATDGPEGVAAARRNPPDLIICDVQLPTIDGYEVARLLKSDPALRSIPIVAVTALAMVGDRDKVLAAGFDGYISKPIDPETFVGQMEGFLRPQQPALAVASIAPESSPVSQPHNYYTVLVVDNLPVNLELARSILEPHGYRVITANDPQEGLRLAKQTLCDLILSDVCMSVESGYEFIARVKADPQLAAIPFVFITSTMVNEKDRLRGLALGAVRFLFRPIEPDLFLAELDACLREVSRSWRPS